MKEYEYYPSNFSLAFPLGIIIIMLMVSFFGDFLKGLLSYVVLGSIAAYLVISIYKNKPRNIELYEDGLIIPSLNGLYIRRLEWENIKSVTLYQRNNDGYIKLHLKKGLNCTIFGGCVNCIGARSKGLEPYEDLLNELKLRVHCA
ncbi:MAG: hypothetical protein HRU20_23895 [Pseudomonadales bacterium]|nr:hypothetical protein [Pseudomonadales bacterium]